MGLYPDGLCLVVDLGIGAILASFNVLGNWPLEIDKLKRFVSEGAILSAVALSMHTEIPSGPLALDTSRPLIRCTSSSVTHNN